MDFPKGRNVTHYADDDRRLQHQRTGYMVVLRNNTRVYARTLRLMVRELGFRFTLTRTVRSTSHYHLTGTDLGWFHDVDLINLCDGGFDQNHGGIVTRYDGSADVAVYGD